MPIKKENKKRYPFNWQEISYRIRFVRAKGACEWPECGAVHGSFIFRNPGNKESFFTVTVEHPTAIQVVLTVAHLNHQPEDCRDENLMALCQFHHLKLDAPFHQANAAKTRRLKKGNLELFNDLYPEKTHGKL